MILKLGFCEIKAQKGQAILRFLRNARGQAAIFVVLIFQVLFILFAMTINISMVAYDKINLQNSLDLAVYYGAKKQAEALNAMAHINYQMRQNWKLLAWRYRIMGTLVQYEGALQGAVLDYWCPQNSDNTGAITNNNCKYPDPTTSITECPNAQSILHNVYGNNYCDRYYFVCISHGLWRRGISQDDGQNLCTKFGVSIPPIVTMQVTAGFMPEAHLAAGGVEMLKEEISASCPLEGALNWLMTQFFMTHFRLDQKDRKVMIQEVYNKTLRAGKDLDGKSIFEGAKNVFCGNLSFANKENVKELCASNSSSDILKEYNPFSGKDFEEIFGKLNVWPVLQFLYDDTPDSTCDVKIGRHYQQQGLTGGQNAFDNVRTLLSNPSDLSKPHSLTVFLTDEVKNLFAFNSSGDFVPSHNDPLRDLTLSFFKKQDQTLYYGLEVDFDYLSENQIFSLSLSEPIKFKASAFAKPFGGNFGPQPGQSDPLIPVFHSNALTSISSSSPPNNALLQPNHSRFPGDKWGLIDKRLHDNNHSSEMNFLNKHEVYNNVQKVYTMENYFHLNLYQGQADDPLARHPDNYNPNTFVRMMELMAVYPDLYDVSYYSILGNYHQTYFKKICKLLRGSECDSNQRNAFPSTASKGRAVYIRGDFGWPDSEKYLEENSKKKGIELSVAPYFLYQGSEAVNRDPITIPPNSNPSLSPARMWGKMNSQPITSPPLSQGNLFYPWLARSDPDKAELPAGLLSSWVNPDPVNYEEYRFDNNRFLKCDGPALPNMPVPSACAHGGRSGYSVKLISCEMVRNFSLQPDNINEYCPN